MRKKLLMIVLCASSLVGYGQEISLEKCQEMARLNHPTLKQSGVIDQLAALRTKSIESSNLPQIDLTGRATYQSEVTMLNVPIPGFKPTTLSKDQYKMYVDVKQKIYDFGMTKNRTLVEESDRKIAQQQNETDLYKLKETVNSLYFQVLILQENERIIVLKNKLLDQRISIIGSAVKNGITQLNDLDNLKSERLLSEQQLIEIKAGMETTVDLLQIITGQSLSTETTFSIPTTLLSDNNSTGNRPELKLFAQQKEKLDASSKLLANSKLPNIYAFGQVGYGRPGLNMLNNSFNDWYLMGIGLSWNLWDGNKSKHDKSILQNQKQIIDIQQENFNRIVELALVQERNQAEKLAKLIETDQQVMQLKENIAKRSASALDNGTITSADYLRDLNASLQSKIALSIHKIQQIQSFENSKIIHGK